MKLGFFSFSRLAVFVFPGDFLEGSWGVAYFVLRGLISLEEGVLCKPLFLRMVEGSLGEEERKSAQGRYRDLIK